jgi:dihydrofolate synthase/folylpolyglutamate synthase
MKPLFAPSWPSFEKSTLIKLGLFRVHKILERLGNPHLKLPPTIHIAGTNGKGSTLAFLKAILNAAGYSTHCYTSPHLVKLNERIILGDKEISDNYLKETIEECHKAALIKPEIPLTFFEAITTAAFLAFSRIKADILLLETGMGGRLDATNCIKDPLISIITPISFDHVEFLGKTLKKIAFEKAGIIKNNCPVIITKQKKSALDELKKIAINKKSPYKIYGQDWKIKSYKNHFVINFFSPNKFPQLNSAKLELPLPSLFGRHQIDNASTAIAALLSQKELLITYNDIKEGLSKASWPARLQKITQGKFYDLLTKKFSDKFELILDGSHNLQGATTVSNWLQEQPKKATYLIFGMLENRNCSKFLEKLKNQINYLLAVAIESENEFTNPKQIVSSAKNLRIISSTSTSYQDAIAKIVKFHNSTKQLRVIICGSLYLAGDFLSKN